MKFFVCILLLAAPSILPAATINWDGSSSGLWSNSLNWSGVLAIPLTDDELVFPAAGANKSMNNDLGAGGDFNRLTFSGSGYTLAGDRIDLSSTVGTPLLRATHTSGTTTINAPFGLLETSIFSAVAGGTLNFGSTGDVALSTFGLTLSSGGTLGMGGTISGSGGVTLSGSGAVRYTALQSYSGTTSLNSGTLTVTGTGSVTNSAISVASIATLAGSGTVNAVTTSGVISPGDGGIGKLTASGNVTFNSATTASLVLELGANTTAGTTYDQLSCGGTVTIGAASVLELVATGTFAPSIGQSYILLSKTSIGAITNTFSGLPQGGFVDLGSKRLQISYTGGDGNDLTATVVNAPPVLAGGSTLGYTENQAAIAINTAITVTDLDNTTLASATVSITGNFASGQDVLGFSNLSMGNIAGSYNSPTGVLTLTSSGATATLAQWQAALRAVTYSNSSNNPATTARTVSYVINDGSSNSNTLASSVNITAVNDTPVLAGSSTLNYIENQAATAINTVITVTDLDHTALSSATVSIPGNFALGQDVLGFLNVSMGNIAGSYNSSTGVLTLTSSGATATLAQWQAALRAVTYSNSSNIPTTTTRTVSYVINDGSVNSNAILSTINVTAVNDAPILVNSSTLSYTENQTGTAINTVVELNDVDFVTFTNATVSITGNFVSGQDLLGLAVVTAPNVFGNYNSSTGVMTLTIFGDPSIFDWRAALRAVTYSNSSENPSTATRTVSYVVNDGAVNSNPILSTINVTAVNDAPVLANGSTLGYTENQAASPINTAITVADVDNATLSTATVSISENYASGQDLLGFNNDFNMGNIVANYNSGTGVMTLTSAGGTATFSQWQAALRAVTYANSSENPGTAARTVSFVVNDGTVDSNTVGCTVTVTAANDAPIAAAQSVNTDEDTPLSITLAATDAEGSPLTYSILSNPTQGVLSGSGSSRTYTPGVNQTGLDSFTFIANDGTVNSDAVTVNITINPINDLPTISAVADQSTPEDGGGIFLNITVSDPDTSISDVVVSSTSTNPGLASVIPNGNTSARNVSVVPAPNQFGSATITLTVSDGQASNTEDFLLTVAPRNDAPVFIKGADVVIAEDAGPQTITGWATGISPGPANESAQTVGFEIASNSNSGLFGTAPSVGPDGTLTFTAAAQANGSAQVGIRLRDNGGTAFVDEQDASAVQQLLITVTAVNDPPVAIAASFVLVKNNSLSMSLAATDVEGGPLTFTIVTPPAHGSFGATTPPNLTYTPDTGYTGTDAFTFKVNDGAADSTAVTVSLEVLDSITHVWDGGGGNDNWSTPQNWMGDTLPPAGAILEFPASALRRTMVNDLVSVFTGLRFTANSYSISGDAVHISSFIESTAAVLNSPVSLLCPLHLEGDVIATRTAASSLRLSNVNTNGFDLEIRNTTNTAFMEIGGSISGSGGLIFDGSSGSLTFFSVSAVGGNSFTGGMHMKSGTVDLLGSSAHPFTVPGSLTIGGEPDKFAFLRNTGFGVSNADVTILEGGRIIVSGLCPVRNLTLAGNGTPINATGASPQLSIAGNLEVIAPVLASLSAPVRFLASSPGPHILSTVAGARLKIEAALACGSSDSLSLTGEGDVFLNAVTTTLPAVTLAGGRFVVGVNVPATNVTLTGGALVGDGTVGSVNGSSGVGGGVYPADAFIELVFPVGTLSCGPLSLNASQTATFDFRNAPLGVGLSGFGTSLLNVSGTVSLGGSALSLNILPDDSPRPGEFITLIANDGTDPVVGTFGGLPEGSILTSGRYSFTLTYVGGTGNDVAVRVGYAPTGVTRIWDGEGANNLWSNPLNWDGNSVPAPGDSVDFPADALRLAGHNDLNMGFVFHRVRFFGGNANHGGNSYVSTGGVEFLNPDPGLISYFTPSIFLGAPMTIRTQGTVSAANLVATRGLPLEFNLGVGGSINLTRGDATAQISPIVKKGAGSLQISDPFSPIHTGQVIIEEGSVVPTNTPATSWLVGGTGSAATLQINQTGSLGAVRVQAGGLLLLANIQCSVAGLTLDSGSVNSLFGGAGPLLRVNGPLAVLTGACAIAPPFQAASATGEERLLTVAAGASLLAAQAVSTDNMGSYFRKAGAGPFTLGFSSPSLTRFEIGEGTAFFNAPASSALIRLQGGTLGGTGAVGNVTTVAGGSLAPGASPGILATKNLFWNSTTAFSIEIGGATPGSGYDQLAVTGSVSLGGATLDMQLINGFSPSSGGIFTLIDNDGVDAVSGTFAGLPEGSSFSAAGTEWLITYQGGTGNDVVVTRQAVQSALEAWRQLNFGSPANSGDAANNFDFDKDGLVNLLEFAFGLDPKSNSAHLLPQAQRVGNELVITFTPPPGVSGITFGAEASGSLAASDWLPVPNTGTAPQRVFRVPIGPENTKFMRLTVSDP